MNGVKKVSFPSFTHYNYAFKYFMENGVGARYIMPPQMTLRTLDRGTKASPDYVCTPFKTTLGSMMDCLEAGADTIFMSMGLCRLGYYGELQEQILRDMGYQFDFVNLSEYSTGKRRDYIKALKRLNPRMSVAKMMLVLAETVKLVEQLDEAEAMYYKNCGFEKVKGSCKTAIKRYHTAVETATTGRELEAAYKKFKKEFNEIELDKPENPLKVGVVGEFLTAQDAFSNLDVEQKLADMGVEVYRYLNATSRMFHYKGKNLHVETSEYCKYDMGPTSTINIWAAKNYASHSFDGIVHIKSAGCTPEIDIMPVLHNISEDYKIPVLYLTYDSQTSDTGLATRLEAFYDMISMRKKVL